MKTMTFYCDPGHGWAKVPLTLIKKLGLQNLISHYSYMSKDHAFVEEDSDATKVFNAIVAATGEKPVIISNHTDGESRIRNMSSYNHAKINWFNCRVEGQ